MCIQSYTIHTEIILKVSYSYVYTFEISDILFRLNKRSVILLKMLIFPNKNFLFRLTLIFSLNCSIMREVVGEVYTAIADMEDVLQLEAQHIKSLESFVRHQEEMIRSMKT